MSTRRYKKASSRKVIIKEGKRFCAMCHKNEVEGRKKYCSDFCRQDSLVRAGFNLRSIIKKRDKEICALCNLDCKTFKKQLNEMKRKHQVHYDYKTNDYIAHENVEIWQEFITENKIPKKIIKGYSIWQVDHVIPVKDGGGSCGLDNLQTLCFYCHDKKTYKKK